MKGKDIICSLAACFMSLTASAYQKPQVCTLHSDWMFCQVGDTLWSDAKVPGTIHQDLLDGLYIGCRGNWEKEVPESYTADTALWAVLTAGAAPVEG